MQQDKSKIHNTQVLQESRNINVWCVHSEDRCGNHRHRNWRRNAAVGAGHGRQDYNAANAISTKLANTVWKDYKNWLEWVKFLIHSASKKMWIEEK